jgi:hypothetical protein
MDAYDGSAEITALSSLALPEPSGAAPMALLVLSVLGRRSSGRAD